MNVVPSRKFYGSSQFCNFCARRPRKTWSVALHWKLSWKKFPDPNRVVTRLPPFGYRGTPLRLGLTKFKVTAWFLVDACPRVVVPCRFRKHFYCYSLCSVTVYMCDVSSVAVTAELSTKFSILRMYHKPILRLYWLHIHTCSEQTFTFLKLERTDQLGLWKPTECVDNCLC